jgi:hypothetical protein
VDESRAPDRQALARDDGDVGAQELLHDVPRIAALIPRAPGGTFVAFAFERDRRAFAATLLAAWSRGLGAALPLDARRCSIEPVMALDDVGLLAHDTGAGTGLDASRALATQNGTEREVAIPPLHGELRCHAPAPDGAFAVRAWPARELSARLAAIGEQMSLPEGASVWSAFRPASPHALLPALLAPLRAGCRVVGGPVGDLETLAAELGARSVHTLVAPASLARALSRRAAPLPASLRQIVVAGEALDGPSSTQLDERGLRVLAVPSLAPTPADAARAELLDLLLGNPDVADAAVEVVHLPDGPHALCVVAAPPGREEELRTVLAARMDSSLQVATALPRDPDGTLARERLLRLFGRNANGRLPSQRLLFRESTPDGVRTFRTKVPADFFGFEGHFPPRQEGTPPSSAPSAHRAHSPRQYRAAVCRAPAGRGPRRAG